MRTITVKLEDDLAESVERVYRREGFATKSELVREALRRWLIAQRQRELGANLQRYLQDEEALRAAAADVEGRRPATQEALARSEEAEG